MVLVWIPFLYCLDSALSKFFLETSEQEKRNTGITIVIQFGFILFLFYLAGVQRSRL